MTRVSSAKKLLALHQLPMDASTLNNGLVLAGVLEARKYLSSTGSGEEKSYLAFTPAGVKFGINAPNGWHEFKTEPKYYESMFESAYLLAATAILEHAQKVLK